jgi:hypothetical protein
LLLLKREKQLFLGFEIQIDRAFGEAGALRDLVDRDRLVGCCLKKIPGNSEQRLAALKLLLFFHGSSSRCHSRTPHPYSLNDSQSIIND